MLERKGAVVQAWPLLIGGFVYLALMLSVLVAIAAFLYLLNELL